MSSSSFRQTGFKRLDIVVLHGPDPAHVTRSAFQDVPSLKAAGRIGGVGYLHTATAPDASDAFVPDLQLGPVALMSRLQRRDCPIFVLPSEPVAPPEPPPGPPPPRGMLGRLRGGYRMAPAPSARPLLDASQGAEVFAMRGVVSAVIGVPHVAALVGALDRLTR